MPLCNLRKRLDILLGMVIKIEVANKPDEVEYKPSNTIFELQRKVARLNAIHELFSQA